MSQAMIWVFIWCFAWPAFWGTGRYLRARQRLAAIKAQAALTPQLPANTAQDEELKMLRDRVKVLERIVVDNRHSDALASDIEALR